MARFSRNETVQVPTRRLYSEKSQTGSAPALAQIYLEFSQAFQRPFPELEMSFP